MLPGDQGSEIDPLDAFMEGLHADESIRLVDEHKAHVLSEFEDEEEETPEELMRRVLGKNSTGDSSLKDSQNDEGDSKHSIESLPPLDHSLVDYPPFSKNLYTVHEDIACLTLEEVVELRKSMNISVSGRSPPCCICSFGHLQLPECVLWVLRYMDFFTPTSIQAQAVPSLLSGRDVMGIATTGSGKTMAYLIPAVVHILENEWQEYPRVLVLCPTRELAVQIEQDAYKFSKRSEVSAGKSGNSSTATESFRSMVLSGGLSKYEQLKELRRGASFLVGNPGRVLDLIQVKKGGLNLSHVSFCVLDEGDRMFHMGFENQIRLIISRIRPDRQMSIFSATMPAKIEMLAREVLSDPVRIVVGNSVGEVSSLVTQNVAVFEDNLVDKWNWLEAKLPQLLTSETASGRILIFVNSKTMVEQLVFRTRQIFDKPLVAGLSSDLTQIERMSVVSEFKSGAINVLVATDIAARGIHVDKVSCVVEFEAPADFNLHVHRIGRTGRAGHRGISWTLLTPHDARLAARIVESMELGKDSNNSAIPVELMNLALTHAPFRAARILAGKEKRSGEMSSWDGMAHHFDKKSKLDLTNETLVTEPLAGSNIETENPTIPPDELAPGVEIRFGKLSKIN